MFLNSSVDLCLKNHVRKFANMNSNEPYSEEQKKIALIAKALGHPVRVYIINFLSKQACCYSGDISDILPIAKSTLSQHLTELKKAGLIQGEIETPKIKYCLNKNNWDLAKKLFKELFDI